MLKCVFVRVNVIEWRRMVYWSLHVKRGAKPDAVEAFVWFWSVSVLVPCVELVLLVPWVSMPQVVSFTLSD